MGCSGCELPKNDPSVLAFRNCLGGQRAQLSDLRQRTVAPAKSSFPLRRKEQLLYWTRVGWHDESPAARVSYPI